MSEKTNILQDNSTLSVEGENDSSLTSIYYRLRLNIYSLMNGEHPWSASLEWLILSVIAINVTTFVLSTDKTADVWWFKILADDVEKISVTIFTIEFALRFWSIVDKEEWKGNPFYARLRFLFSFMSFVDLISILPFYVSLFLSQKYRLSFSPTFRIFRVFRLFKAEKYSHSFTLIGRVIAEQKDILLATAFLNLVLLVLQASLLWIMMKDVDPEHFGSIPRTMYWSLLMLTGMGAFDDFSYTFWAQVLNGITAIIAVALFSIPIGVLANGFQSALSDQLLGENNMVSCPACGHNFHVETTIQ